MDKGEVQAIVEQTIKALKRQGLLKDDYNIVLKETEPIIRDFFKNKKQNNDNITAFLDAYKSDAYIDIIYLHYRDGLTIERIAEEMSREVSTIKRNKKRLIMKLYDSLEV